MTPAPGTRLWGMLNPKHKSKHRADTHGRHSWPWTKCANTPHGPHQRGSEVTAGLIPESPGKLPPGTQVPHTPEIAAAPQECRVHVTSLGPGRDTSGYSTRLQLLWNPRFSTSVMSPGKQTCSPALEGTAGTGLLTVTALEHHRALF